MSPNLPWSEVTTVELKSAMFQLLVIGMRNPEKSPTNGRGYRGWVMRRKQRKWRLRQRSTQSKPSELLPKMQ